MRPFLTTTMLRPLTDHELRLEEPEWLDDDTVSFYIPCWFHVDSVFAGIHVETEENDDYINLYCNYNIRKQRVSLSIYYANNSAGAGEQDFDIEVEADASTSDILLQKAAAWLNAAYGLLSDEEKKNLYTSGAESVKQYHKTCRCLQDENYTAIAKLCAGSEINHGQILLSADGGC